MRGILRFLSGLALSGLLSVSALAADGTITTKDAAGATRTFTIVTDGSGNYIARQVLCDRVAGANCAAVDASNRLSVLATGSGTAGTAATGVLTVQGIASMTPVQVSQATAASLNATVVGTGTFATQSAITAAGSSIASGALAVGSGTDGWDVSTGATSAAAATAGSTGSVNAKLRLMTTQLDTMNTNLQAGTASFGATFPTSGVALGFSSGGNLTAISGLTAGADNLTNSSAGFVQHVLNYVYDGSTWDRWTGAVTATATLAAETTKVIGTVRNFSGTGQNLNADPCEQAAQTSTPISITTATTTRIVAPSASNKTYICYLMLTSAAADNVGIVEGTGGTCGSGTAGVIGGTTAANGPNFAANGGVSMTAGGKVAVAVTAGTNVDLCLITSAATPLAGVIKWVQAP